MKHIMKTAFFAGCLTMALTTGSTNAGLFSSFNPTKALDQVIATVSSKGAPYLCRKGDAIKGLFSGRSFEGRLCDKKEFAAIMEVTCKGTNLGYEGSGCATKAAKALKGTTAEAVLAGLKDKGMKTLAAKVGATTE